MSIKVLRSRTLRSLLFFRCYRTKNWRSGNYKVDLGSSKTVSNGEEALRVRSSDGSPINPKMLDTLGASHTKAEARRQKDDLLCKYLDFIKSDYERSKSNLQQLQRSLLDDDTLDDNARFKLVFLYAVEESEIEMELYNKYGIDGLQKILIKNRDNRLNNGNIEQQLFKHVFNINESVNGKIVVFKNYKFLLKLLGNLYENLATVPLKEMPVSVDDLVAVYEIAKVMPLKFYRVKGMFLAAKIIYSTGKIRMDPVNESFYIETLMSFNDKKTALELFKTNKDKVNQKWWHEVGMMLALSCNDLKLFKEILSEYDRKYVKDAYLTPKILRLAISKYKSIGSEHHVNKLVERVIKVIQMKPIETQEQNKKHPVFFESLEEANMYFNENDAFTTTQITKMFSSFLRCNNQKAALNILAAGIISSKGSSDFTGKFVMLSKVNLLREPRHLTCKLWSLSFFGDSQRQIYLKEFERNLISLVSKLNSMKKSTGFTVSSLRELSKIPLCTQFVNDYTNAENNRDLLSIKKQLLLQTLLRADKEEEALTHLTKLENKSNDLGTDDVDDTINAYHYGQFIKFYTIKARNAPLKRRIGCQNSVNKILNRMTENNVDLNYFFIVNILQFYCGLKDYDNAFRIVNQLLSAKFETDMKLMNGLKLSKKKESKKALYLEFWKIYFNYYKYNHHYKLTFHGKRIKKEEFKVSSEENNEQQVTPKFSHRDLFHLMLNNGVELMSEKVYGAIIKCFIYAKDWDALPAILSQISDQQSLELSEQNYKFILKAIKNAYVEGFSKRKFNPNNCSQSKIHKKEIECLRKLIAKKRFVNTFSTESVLSKSDVAIIELLNLRNFLSNDCLTLDDVFAIFKEFSVSSSNVINLMQYVSSMK